MSSSASEYLRRKMQALPRTYGPSIYGDASQRTAVLRYRNSRNPTPDLTKSTTPSCCDSVPTGGPYRGKNGDGQQQEWSVDGLIASRVCCAPLSKSITIPGCCPPDRKVAGIFYDASGVPITAAYQGAKKCCDFQATLDTIKKAQEPSRCSCAVDQKTHINTLLANDVPIEKIPVPPAFKPCCVPPVYPCTCCGADGLTHTCD